MEEITKEEVYEEVRTQRKNIVEEEIQKRWEKARRYLNELYLWVPKWNINNFHPKIKNYLKATDYKDMKHLNLI
jgi:hypothetical protein